MCCLQSHQELQVSAPIGDLFSLPNPRAASRRYNSISVGTQHCHFVMRKTSGGWTQRWPLPAKSSPAVSPFGFYSRTADTRRAGTGTGEGGSCQDAACRKGSLFALIYQKMLGWTVSNQYSLLLWKKRETCRVVRGGSSVLLQPPHPTPAHGTLLTGALTGGPSVGSRLRVHRVPWMHMERMDLPAHNAAELGL